MRLASLVPSVPLTRSLSGRLLVLTLFFVMVSEVLIFVPSVAKFRTTYLQDRIAAAQLASFALMGEAERLPTPRLEQDILDQAEIIAIVLKNRESRTLILGESVNVPHDVSASFDLRHEGIIGAIVEAFQAMANPGRTIRVVGPAIEDPETLIDIVIDEQPLRYEMFGFSRRVLVLSLLISFITGALVYLTLHVVIVRPLGNLTQSMVDFRRDPETERTTTPTTTRRDEIGLAEREFASMQEDLRLALKQKARLAELGTAVSKINHDLRNILATAQLVSDRLSESADPEVRRATPVLLRAIDRAIWLCSQSLQFGRVREQKPQRSVFVLHDLVNDVGVALGLGAGTAPGWDNETPVGLRISADQEQLFRVLMNLGRNAMEALGTAADGRISIEAAALGSSVVIEFSDNGPGIPEDARANLFKPFSGTTKSSGTGLGLTIAKDLVEGHGGTMGVHRSDESGTTFRIEIPTNVVEMGADSTVQMTRVQ